MLKRAELDGRAIIFRVAPRRLTRTECSGVTAAIGVGSAPRACPYVSAHLLIRPPIHPLRLSLNTHQEGLALPLDISL